MENNGRNYVIVKSCGCFSYAVYINPEHLTNDKSYRKQIAKELGLAIVRGEDVRQVTVEFIRQGHMSCEKCKVTP